MSLNQSKAEKSEAQSTKPDRSFNLTQQKSFPSSGGKGGGVTAPPASSNSSSVSSLSASRSFKKSGNGQGSQSRVGQATSNSESSAATSASHLLQNGAPVQSRLQNAPSSNSPKSKESSISRSSRGLPRSPISQSTAGALDSAVTITPSKGDVSRPFPLQFGSFSPGFMNGMQVPTRTYSAPPNLDEQRHKQAHNDSLKALPTSPIPSPKQEQQQQQRQLKKDAGTIHQSNIVESQPAALAKKEVHVQNPEPVVSTTLKSSSFLPAAGVSMPIPFRPPQVPVQFGGPSPQLQSRGITPSSLQMPMPLHVGNATQVQQQIFAPGLQSHPLQSQGIMHQGQNLAFAPHMAHQLVPQLGNLGMGMPPHFTPQQGGNFGAPRKTVKITHPGTREELKLNKRKESHTDVSSLGPRSHPNMPTQSQPVTSFPVNYYSPMRPNSYNPPSIFFPTSTSLPLTSSQVTSGSSASGYNYLVGQGGQNISYMNPPPVNLPSFNKAAHPTRGKSDHPTHGKSEPIDLEQVHDGLASSVSAPYPSASVQKTVKPAVGSLAEKLGGSSVAVPSSFDSVPLPATAKHSTPSVAVSAEEPPLASSTSLLSVVPAEGSLPATNSESRRKEPIRRSESLKGQQKKHSKKDARQIQQRARPDASHATDSAGLTLSISKMSKDDSSSDLNDDQVHRGPDENGQAPFEAVGQPKSKTVSNFHSSSLDCGGGSVLGISEAEETTAVPSMSETSSATSEPVMEVSLNLTCSVDASKTTIHGVEDGEGGHGEPSDPSGFGVDNNMFGNIDATHWVEQCDSVPREVGQKHDVAGKMENMQTKIPDHFPQFSTNPKVGSTILESSKYGGQAEEVSDMGAATDDMQEKALKSSCTDTEHIGSNGEAMHCSSEVDRTKDNFVRCAITLGSGHAETASISYNPLTNIHEYKSSSADASKNISRKSTGSEEVAQTESGISNQEIEPNLPSFSSEATWKLEGKGSENTSGNQMSTAAFIPKDRISVEQNQAKSPAVKKKKRKEILKKAEVVGRTSDLYAAYKGPEEKHDISITSASKDSSLVADEKQASADYAEKDAAATENVGQSKGEVDDWEDAAEISTPKLETSRSREVCDAQKQNDEYGSEIMCKRKYSRDFLLTFAKQCSDLPAGFVIGSDLVDVLMSSQVAASHLDQREAYPNTGRIIDRTVGGSRLDRRGIGVVDDDKWSKATSHFASGREPRLDVGFGGAGVNFRPGQGGIHGVLRNPRGQSSGQYVGGILAGPMQSVTSQGAMSRNSPDADRWQRATGIQSQRGLIPPLQTPLQAMHKAEKKYKVGKVSDEEETKQRRLKAILNKLTPQNFEKLFEQVKAVNIDNTTTLTGVISQIFDKALMEPTFCEMYANFCFFLAGALPDFSEDNEKITFKRLLLNKCQEEFERGEREEAEANRDDEGEIKRTKEEKEQKKVQARRRMLGNIRLIGELYKKRMLTERIMHECIKKLLGQYENPDEEDIEALCKLMSTIGEMIDHPKAKEHMDVYFDMMQKLSNNQKLSSRLRFMLKDAIDLRKNRWQQRRKVEGPKKIEEVHRDAAQELQAQASRLSRGPVVGSTRRAPPLDYGNRASTLLSSPNTQQIGALRGLSTHIRGYGIQDVRMEERHPFENRTPPLPQRLIDDDSITLGPQGGLAKGMSIRGQPLMSSAPSADVPSSHNDPRRVALGPNGYNSVSEYTSYNNAREELMPRHVPSNSQVRTAYFGSKDSRNADPSFDRSVTSPPATRCVQGASTGAQNAPSETNVSKERLRDLSIAAIREYYSARNEDEVRLCIKDLNYPSYYPNMVMLWVTDSFDRKKDIDRDLLAKLLVSLCKSQDSLLSQVHLIKGFESVFSTLEDAVTDSPKAAEYLGHILGRVILENAISLREIGRLICEGGDEPGSLRQSGLASDVLASILDSIRREKGESVLNEIRINSNLRVEDFRPPDPIKSGKLDTFF